MEIRLETELDWRELDEFLEVAEGATCFQSSTFLWALQESYGFRVGFLVQREGGALKALLPFSERSKRGFKILECLPFGAPGGPLVAPDAEPALGRYLLDAYLSRVGGRTVSATAVLPADPSIESEADDLMLTQIVDLSPGYEALAAKAVAPAKRRQVRQSGERGVSCRRSVDPEDLRAWYAVYMENVSRWKLEYPTTYEFLERLLRDEDRVEFTVAEHEGQLVGASLDLYQCGEAYYWMGASRRELGHLRVSAALYDARMKRACERGMMRLNLGFSPGKPELFRYKRDFGGQPAGSRLLKRSVPWFTAMQRLRGRGA